MSTLGTFVSRKKTRLRQSLISFALVQNCYEHEVLHEQRAQTAKVKRYYETRNQVEKETCAKIISEIDHSNP